MQITPSCRLYGSMMHADQDVISGRDFKMKVVTYVSAVRHLSPQSSRLSATRRRMARKDKGSTAGKGFGKSKAPETPKSTRSKDELEGMNVLTGGAKLEVSKEEVLVPKTNLKADPEAPINIEEAIESSTLFKSTRARQEALLDEKIARLKEEEDLIASDPSVGAVPELVADRMIGRIAAFFGVPVFGGLAIFVGAFFYSKQTDTVIQPSVIAYATQVPFVLGLIGITYGILSASWEPENEGSKLGVSEFKTNLGRIRDGLKRTRETAELKDEIETEMKKTGRRK
jgi:hypothetical protein